MFNQNTNKASIYCCVAMVIAFAWSSAANAHRHDRDRSGYSDYERDQRRMERTRAQEERMDEYVEKSRERADRLLGK